jgi:hypothetical protein
MYDEQIHYLKWLAFVTHKHGMGVGLKVCPQQTHLLPINRYFRVPRGSNELVFSRRTLHLTHSLLQNNIAQIKALAGTFDFAVNEGVLSREARARILYIRHFGMFF